MHAVKGIFLYFSTMYQYRIETDLYTLSLGTKLQKSDDFHHFWWISKLISTFLLDKNMQKIYLVAWDH